MTDIQEWVRQRAAKDDSLYERYGKPLAFYSDKHGIFRVNQPQTLVHTPTR